MINHKPVYNKILNSEVALQLDEKVVTSQVNHRLLVPEVKIVGSYYDKPMLNSMIYEVEFTDSQVKDYALNVIVKNILSQVDDK